LALSTSTISTIRPGPRNKARQTAGDRRRPRSAFRLLRAVSSPRARAVLARPSRCLVC
jgi:hypothetical protein